MLQPPAVTTSPTLVTMELKGQVPEDPFCNIDCSDLVAPVDMDDADWDSREYGVVSLKGLDT
ncbi:hypothetical protein MICRO8M_140028 [Microbacterium sp. 8M]|nr:hypothetical protein MICRO8M_140028 [Microbacterium sp. 8M]